VEDKHHPINRSDPKSPQVISCHPFHFGCFYCPQITANKMAMTAKPC
jgi:hypothetical protein